jgi:hypothetical protein
LLKNIFFQRVMVGKAASFGGSSTAVAALTVSGAALIVDSGAQH